MALAQVIMEAGRSKICRADIAVRNPSGKKILPYSGVGQPCVLFRPSTDWIRPTHHYGKQSVLLSLLI